ncbi:MAG TPA: hypothetical protein VE776_12945, partial [Actinomycetota bacterium]|nr:hypothetical protein [Actinomycetota bacterium]
DAALVDAPCSNLGTLRRRPEARWRHGPAELERLAALQLELLEAAACAVRPGGHVLYSVCTWTGTETDEVVDAALARHPELEPAPLAGPAAMTGAGAAGGPAAPPARRQYWPHRHGSDGIFIARLRKIH